jgi:hypothetical protein
MTASTRSMFFDIAGVGQSNVMGQRASTQTVLGLLPRSRVGRCTP